MCLEGNHRRGANIKLGQSNKKFFVSKYKRNIFFKSKNKNPEVKTVQKDPMYTSDHSNADKYELIWPKNMGRRWQPWTDVKPVGSFGWTLFEGFYTGCTLTKHTRTYSHYLPHPLA